MDVLEIKSRRLNYKDFQRLGNDEALNENIIKFYKRHSTLNAQLAATAKSNFKDSRNELLNQAGTLKDDETLDELLAHIYKERGRSETE